MGLLHEFDGGLGAGENLGAFSSVVPRVRIARVFDADLGQVREGAECLRIHRAAVVPRHDVGLEEDAALALLPILRGDWNRLTRGLLCLRIAE